MTSITLKTHPLMEVFSLFLFIIVCSVTHGQVFFDSEVYSQKVNKIETIDPYYTNFQDLDFLRDKLKDKQIVILGESGHGDGSTFLAKTRLIKYLTSELGFNTVALEGGGFFDIYYASYKVSKGDSLHKELSNAWYHLWSMSKQTQEFINHLEKNNSKIDILGIDNQAGNLYWLELPNVLGNLFNDEVYSSVDPDKFKTNYLLFYYAYVLRMVDVNKVNILQFRNDISLIKANILKINDEHSAAMHQALLNLERFIDQMLLDDGTYSHQNLSINLRDSMMAENVKWYLQRNPDRKVIIWTANLHAADNLNEAIYAEDDDFYHVLKPLGQRLKDQYGNKVFNVAFTSSEGENATIYDTIPSIIKIYPESWESELSNQIQWDYAFIDFEVIRKSNKYDHYTFSSSLLGYNNKQGNWLNIFDGVFFIRRMERSDYHLPFIK